MKALVKWAIDRLKEGSSWAGIAIIAAAFGIDQSIVTEGFEVIVAIAGLAAVLLKDKAPAPDEGAG